LAVNVDGVQPRDEVDENVVHALGDLAQKRLGDSLIGGVFFEVDGDEELLSLLVDVANINTTLVGKEDPVTLKRMCQPQGRDVR
jgi:hypothetical protein